jgi:hypothetical protein
MGFIKVSDIAAFSRLIHVNYIVLEFAVVTVVTAALAYLARAVVISATIVRSK